MLFAQPKNQAVVVGYILVGARYFCLAVNATFGRLSDCPLLLRGIAESSRGCLLGCFPVGRHLWIRWHVFWVCHPEYRLFAHLYHWDRNFGCPGYVDSHHHEASGHGVFLTSG